VTNLVSRFWSALAVLGLVGLLILSSSPLLFSTADAQAGDDRDWRFIRELPAENLNGTALANLGDADSWLLVYVDGDSGVYAVTTQNSFLTWSEPLQIAGFSDVGNQAPADWFYTPWLSQRADGSLDLYFATEEGPRKAYWWVHSENGQSWGDVTFIVDDPISNGHDVAGAYVGGAHYLLISSVSSVVIWESDGPSLSLVQPDDPISSSGGEQLSVWRAGDTVYAGFNNGAWECQEASMDRCGEKGNWTFVSVAASAYHGSAFHDNPGRQLMIRQGGQVNLRLTTNAWESETFTGAVLTHSSKVARGVWVDATTIVGTANQELGGNSMRVVVSTDSGSSWDTDHSFDDGNVAEWGQGGGYHGLATNGEGALAAWVNPDRDGVRLWAWGVPSQWELVTVHEIGTFHPDELIRGIGVATPRSTPTWGVGFGVANAGTAFGGEASSQVVMVSDDMFDSSTDRVFFGSENSTLGGLSKTHEAQGSNAGYVFCVGEEFDGERFITRWHNDMGGASGSWEWESLVAPVPDVSPLTDHFGRGCVGSDLLVAGADGRQFLSYQWTGGVNPQHEISSWAPPGKGSVFRQAFDGAGQQGIDVLRLFSGGSEVSRLHAHVVAAPSYDSQSFVTLRFCDGLEVCEDPGTWSSQPLRFGGGEGRYEAADVAITPAKHAAVLFGSSASGGGNGEVHFYWTNDFESWQNGGVILQYGGDVRSLRLVGVASGVYVGVVVFSDGSLVYLETEDNGETWLSELISTQAQCEAWQYPSCVAIDYDPSVRQRVVLGYATDTEVIVAHKQFEPAVAPIPAPVVFVPAPVDMFDPSDSFFGVPVGPLADSLGTSVAGALGFLAVLMVMGLIGGLFWLTKSAVLSLAAGGGLGLVLATMMGLIELWVMLVVVLVMAGIIVLWLRGGGGS
jgi:hypothetical protein